MKYLLYSLAALVIIASISALAFYFWPTTSKQLQTTAPTTNTFRESAKEVASLVAAQKANGVTADCTSQLLIHADNKAQKSVVLFHGITACPSQFKAFGQQLFDAGYNVYIPLAPYHGTNEPRGHKDVRSP